MTEQQFNEITAWQKETFPAAKAESFLYHLLDEVKELHSSIITDDPERRLEFADCLILLVGAADKVGMTYQDLFDAVQEKFEINKTRKWGKPDANGVVNHIK